MNIISDFLKAFSINCKFAHVFHYIMNQMNLKEKVKFFNKNWLWLLLLDIIEQQIMLTYQNHVIKGLKKTVVVTI